MAITVFWHALDIAARVLLLVVAGFSVAHLFAGADSGESARWGDAPYAQERPAYMREVMRYRHELQALGQALGAIERNRALYADRRNDNSRAFQGLRRLPGWDADLARRREAAREAYEAAWGRWATQRIATLPLDLSGSGPTPRAARGHLWRYDLERLQRRAAYLRAELLYREMELAAMRADYGRHDPIGQPR